MSRLNATLGRASSGGTVQMAPPPASDRASSTAYGEFVSGVKDVTQGRVSLLILNTLIVLLILFYLWTHSAQGGG